MSVIISCRLCKSNDIIEILNLGNLALSGVFPCENEEIASLPIALCECRKCGLIQLYHDFDIKLLYGETYGYRSGLNASMVQHLQNIVDKLSIFANDNCNILDIGSNDGTLLNLYSNRYNKNFYG